MAAVVQVGLYDRYCRGQRRPDFMVGNSNGDAAMMVGAGLQTFEDMVRASQALDTLKPVEKVVSIAAEPAPLLTGLSLTEYRAIEAVQSETGLSYALLPDTSMEMKRAIGNLHATKGVTRFITIGPAAAMRPADFTALDSDEIETLDSIELDPMLGWFWRGVRTPVMALA